MCLRSGQAYTHAATQCRTVRSSAVQDAERQQEEDLARQPPGTFTDGIAIRPNDFPTQAVKYLWDFFPPSYTCPLREKVGLLVSVFGPAGTLLAASHWPALAYVVW